MDSDTPIKVENTQRFKKIENELKEKNCTLISVSGSTIKYVCACKLERTQEYSDWKRRECRRCRDSLLKMDVAELVSSDHSGMVFVPENTDGEEWKPIVGGWISSRGNAFNVLGKQLTLCPTKFRYRINGKHQYASRLVATSFKIDGYEKLEMENVKKSYVVIHVDGDEKNNCLENLKVGTKSEIGKRNGSLTHKSDRFRETLELNPSDVMFIGSKQTVVPEIPTHTLYDTGHIWNGTRFLAFSVSKHEKYLSFIPNIGDKPRSYKVHRLICYAFNPIEGKKSFDDYDTLHVNHKNGNVQDNHAANLEWCTASENMKHAYENGLNSNKVCGVIQIIKTPGSDDVQEVAHPSIAHASRETGETEWCIREVCKGKTPKAAKYGWRRINPDRAEVNTVPRK